MSSRAFGKRRILHAQFILRQCRHTAATISALIGENQIVVNSTQNWEAQMSTAKAERYARRARNCDTVEDVGDYMKRAVDELVEAIRDLEARVKRLESKVR